MNLMGNIRSWYSVLMVLLQENMSTVPTKKLSLAERNCKTLSRNVEFLVLFYSRDLRHNTAYLGTPRTFRWSYYQAASCMWVRRTWVSKA